MVLTFRNVHNWTGRDAAAPMFAAMYAAIGESDRFTLRFRKPL